MRVLWLSHNVPYPPTTGVLQRNFHLIRQLARRSELHLVALRQTALCPDDAALQAAQTELSGSCASLRILDLDWETSPAARLRLAAGLLRGIPYDVARYTSTPLARLLAEDDLASYDVAHFDTLGLIPYRACFRESAVALNHHNAESRMLARRARNAPPLRRGLYAWQAGRTRAWEREYCPQFDCNLVVSDVDQERLAAIAPSARFSVVPNGVDPAYFDRPANREPGNFKIVSVGPHSWYPNRDAALYFLDEIWPRITAVEPEARWVVVGADPDDRVVEAARADRRISVLGFVDDLRTEVQSAAVFACSFREGGGSRLKVLDALAMRKAIVSTSVGVEGIPMSADAHYLHAEEPAVFADRVLELFRDPDRRAELGEQGRAFVEARFSWEQIGADLDRLYRELAAKRSD